MRAQLNVQAVQPTQADAEECPSASENATEDGVEDVYF